MVQFNWSAFSDLSVDELYALLALRSQVFVVEQNCVYLDPDGQDSLALHLLASVNGELVGNIRLFPPTSQAPYLKFGRIATPKEYRRHGYGRLLMQEMLRYSDERFPATEIRCSAQYYLRPFYESFGFVAVGDIYDEDGIDHIEMRRSARKNNSLSNP